MSTNYPSSTDTFAAVTSGQPRDGTGTSPAEPALLTNLGDAIEAIETELGPNPKGSASHVAARILAAESGATSAIAAAASAAAAAAAAQTTANAAIAKAIVDAKGDLIVGTGADTVDRLAAGTNGFVLKANSGTASGLEWAAETGGSVAMATDPLWDAKGDLALGTGANTGAKLTVGTNDQGLLADSAQTQGAKWYDVLLGRKGGKDIVETTASSGTAKTIDLINGNCFNITLTGNCTFTLTGMTNGVMCSFIVILRQDATGSRTITWPAAVKWAGGSTPVWTTTASKADIVAFFSVDGGTNVYGSVIGQAFS